MTIIKFVTNYGLKKAADCAFKGIPFSVKYIAVGDGAGVIPVPNKDDTALVNEVWRGEISEIIDNSPQYSVISYIPENVGDFVIREMGVFDEENKLLYVSQMDETPKSTVTSGIAKQIGIKAIFELQQGLDVILIDPSIVMASKDYVSKNYQPISEKGVPSGYSPLNENNKVPDIHLPAILDPDLLNLSDMAKSKLQDLRLPVYCVNSSSVDSEGNANMLSATEYTQKIYAAAGTYSLTLAAGQYEVEMYGAGGGYYHWSYQKASGNNWGGAGAGFKGVIEIPEGNYTITVGAYNGNATNGGDTSFDSLIVCGGGGYDTNGYGSHPKGWCVGYGDGGTLSVSDDVTIISSELQSNGNHGGCRATDGGANTNIRVDGSQSLYDNTLTGYGAGSSSSGVGYSGYFRIKSIGGNYTTISVADFIATNSKGKTFSVANVDTIDVSSFENGTYNIYCDADGYFDIRDNNHFVQKYRPAFDDVSHYGDIFVDTSVQPISVQEYTSSGWVDFDKVLLGNFTLEDSVITSINTEPYNKIYLVPAYIIDTYINGASGYRIWSDGYCEQWGKVNSPGGNSGATPNLLRSYKDTSYNISATTIGDSGSANVTLGVTNVSVSYFTLHLDRVSGAYWRTIGYI